MSIDHSITQHITHIEQLAWREDIAAASQLVEYLQHEHPYVRRAAATALGQIARAETSDALIKTLHDSEANVRYAAANALARIGSRHAGPALQDLLDDPDADVRRAGIRALGHIGTTRAVPALRKALHDENEFVAQAAARALGEIGDRYIISTIMETHTDLQPVTIPDAKLPSPSLARRFPFSIPRERIGTIILVSMLTLLAGLALSALWLWNRPLGPNLVPPPAEQVLAMPTPAAQPQCGGPPVMFVLVIGADSAGGNYTQGFADVIRVARIDFVDPKLHILSIPRDLWVRIPGLEPQGIIDERLKTAYAYGIAYDVPGGGPALLADTIAANFGVYFDHYAVGNFDSFSNGIDAIGGITLNIPQSVAEFDAGTQHMDGETALRYARLRLQASDTSDLARIDRQTQIILAIQQRITSPEMLPRVPKIARSMRDAVLTDLRPREISTLICIAEQISTEDISILSIDEPYFSRYEDAYGHERLDPDYEALTHYLHAFYRGEFPLPSPQK